MLENLNIHDDPEQVVARVSDGSTIDLQRLKSEVDSLVAECGLSATFAALLSVTVELAFETGSTDLIARILHHNADLLEEGAARTRHQCRGVFDGPT
jgi:hypothetical protein